MGAEWIGRNVRGAEDKSDGKTLFCLELAKYFNLEDSDAVNEVRQSKQVNQPEDRYYY